MKASRYKRGRFLAGGVAAGFGTMNSVIQIIIGERQGWGDAHETAALPCRIWQQCQDAPDDGNET